MMKIKTIEIKGFRAFYGKYKFDINGRNVFVYGENGSGKSSFYYAIKDFFQSSLETIDFDSTENIFLTKRTKGKGYVKIVFNPNKDGIHTDKLYTASKNTTDTFSATDTSIRDAVKLKSFLTYKHLLGIHHIQKGRDIDLFDLLVKGVLKHYKNIAITGSKELGQLWSSVEDAISKPLNGTAYNMTQKRKDVDAVLKVFNTAMDKLLKKTSPEYIVDFSQPILDKFGHNIQIELSYAQARPNVQYTAIESNAIKIKVKYLNKDIEKPHIFLNEARLSAIAISIYLGMIKRHIQGLPLKVLFLDDIFIGLDISNRLPLLKILDTEFSNYQIIITTYDKPWYEFVKTTYLANNTRWKNFEFYARRVRKGFEIPIVRDLSVMNGSFIDSYISIAEDFFSKGDNKAAGVYLRSAYEFILKRYCYDKVPVKFNINPAKLDTEDFWNAVKKYKTEKPTKCGLTPGTKNDIDSLTKLTLNSLSHHDVNKHEISSEIQKAIDTLRNLKNELGV